MNISVNVDCTPEEARRFMGLPDLTSIHDAYLDRVRETIEQGITPENAERLMRSWGPMGEAGMNIWRQMIEQMSGKAG